MIKNQNIQINKILLNQQFQFNNNYRFISFKMTFDILFEISKFIVRFFNDVNF